MPKYKKFCKFVFYRGKGEYSFFSGSVKIGRMQDSILNNVKNRIENNPVLNRNKNIQGYYAI